MEYTRNERKAPEFTQYAKQRGPVSLYILTNNLEGWGNAAQRLEEKGIDAHIGSTADELKTALSQRTLPKLMVIDVQKRRARDQGPDGFKIATLLKGGGPSADVPLLLIDDTLEESRVEWFFSQNDVSVRKYGEPKIHLHAIKKLLKSRSEPEGAPGESVG